MTQQTITVQQIIDTLGLAPLPVEGGLYRETYRSEETTHGEHLAERYTGKVKPHGTAILYLLTGEPGSFSALHRLPTDEVYHFYLGDPLEMTLLYPDGSHRLVILGQDLLRGQHVQFTVPRGVWQGSRVAPGGQYSLVGTTMAPGYTPDDFEAGDRETLLKHYPQARDQILALTRE